MKDSTKNKKEKKKKRDEKKEKKRETKDKREKSDVVNETDTSVSSKKPRLSSTDKDEIASTALPPVKNNASIQKSAQESQKTHDSRNAAPPAIEFDESLIDPKLLEGLTEEQRKEALASAMAAKRAEERAEQRALERALRRKEEERQREKALRAGDAKVPSLQASGIGTSTGERITYVPKQKRAEEKTEQAVQNSKAKEPTKPKPQSSHYSEAVATKPLLSEREMTTVKKTYLGNSAVEPEEQEAKNQKKKKHKKKITFRFRWDDTDDTFDAEDPLYSSTVSLTEIQRRKKQALSDTGDVATVSSVQSKPLAKMTARDWRIFRENYEIIVKGGRTPPPMRSFRESPSPDIPPLHPTLLDAIENVMRFKEPSPIQRQGIPIGLQRRDLIGIAETGSGKTVAFGLPLCHYLLNLPSRVLDSVATEGPLALVMAPTRELALQIDGEIAKLLSRQRRIKTVAIVGGQQIQQQAQQLRNGVHIVVGTPGRINDCIDMAYLVLNQCCYIVLDEADRMIDMVRKRTVLVP